MNLREIRTDIDRINAELGPGRSAEQKAAWGKRCDEFRDGSRMLFHIELSTVARFDNWTDEEAALLLAGIPLTRRESVSDPAYEIQLGLAHYILRLIDSGSTERRSPRAWIAWADSKEIRAPGKLREAVGAQLGTRPAVPTDNKLLATIAALLAAWPGGRARWPSGADLEKAAQSVGVNVSDDTLRKAMRAAEELISSK